ncbi:UDP-glucuronosyl and UDP-glucosyl transferase [Handroanthus impetiginosus]|uniref:Glycosyltransferase n=1 Tax=Handroanthus impetiginosus TaxID=429701 RepID=A0A2G9G7L3_9LAMI|nr:UDP-glucuronosyl and UDP-glucosyl transferase [Handroanthus impetiginosus]
MADHTHQIGDKNHEESQVAVVMVPLPAQGHLNQLLHLSRLLSAASLPVYYVGAATHIRQAKLRVQGWDLSTTAAIHFHEFPTPRFENPLPNPHSLIKFPAQIVPSLSASLNLRDPVFNFVKELSKSFRRVIVIYDFLMAYVVQDIPTIQNSESYCFRSISSFYLYSFCWDAAGRPDLHLPDEAKNVLKEIPSRDGVFSPEFTDFSNVQRESNRNFSGDIYNSSRAIEGLYLDLLAKEKTTGTDKTWAIGPFNPVLIPEKKSHKCLEWLEKQPQSSVIFVSFGTTCSLSDEQVKELALGLERSEQRFIWVLRDADKGDIFTGDVRKVELPEGFEGRVKERGIILTDWAPQLAILSHSATGGFMSHCGWNSCIESISMGVPMATWPMHSDQPTNAVLITKALRIGVEVRDWEHRDGVLSANTVENAIRRLMASSEGDEMRKRAKELGADVRNSVMEGGSSHMEMKSFISHITR